MPNILFKMPYNVSGLIFRYCKIFLTYVRCMLLTTITRTILKCATFHSLFHSSSHPHTALSFRTAPPVRTARLPFVQRATPSFCASSSYSATCSYCAASSYCASSSYWASKVVSRCVSWYACLIHRLMLHQVLYLIQRFTKC